MFPFPDVVQGMFRHFEPVHAADLPRRVDDTELAVLSLGVRARQLPHDLFGRESRSRSNSSPRGP